MALSVRFQCSGFSFYPLFILFPDLIEWEYEKLEMRNEKFLFGLEFAENLTALSLLHYTLPGSRARS